MCFSWWHRLLFIEPLLLIGFESQGALWSHRCGGWWVNGDGLKELPGALEGADPGEKEQCCC